MFWMWYTQLYKAKDAEERKCVAPTAVVCIISGKMDANDGPCSS